MDDALLLVGDRNDSAAGFHFRVAAVPLAASHFVQEVSERPIAGHRSRLSEQNLADVDGQVVVGVDVFGEFRDFRTEGPLVVGIAAVAVELHVSQMPAETVEGSGCLKRGFPVPRNAEVVAMHVHRVRQAEFVHRLGDASQNLPGRNVEVFDRVVETVGVATGRLPDFDATRIDQLRRVTLGGIEQPGDVGLHLVLFAGVQLFHHVVVVAHQDVEALVENGRVLHLLVRVAGDERGDRGVERRRVSQTGVEVTGGERTGDAACGPRTREGRAADGIGGPLVVRHHLAGGVDLRPRDVAVHVDPARHDDHPGRIQRAVGSNPGIARRINDNAVSNPDVADLAIDPVGGVVERTVGDA